MCWRVVHQPVPCLVATSWLLLPVWPLLGATQPTVCCCGAGGGLRLVVLHSVVLWSVEGVALGWRRRLAAAWQRASPLQPLACVQSCPTWPACSSQGGTCVLWRCVCCEGLWPPAALMGCMRLNWHCVCSSCAWRLPTSARFYAPSRVAYCSRPMLVMLPKTAQGLAGPVAGHIPAPSPCLQLRSAAPGSVAASRGIPGIRRCTTACLQQGDCPSIEWGPCQHVRVRMHAAQWLLLMLLLQVQRVWEGCLPQGLHTNLPSTHITGPTSTCLHASPPCLLSRLLSLVCWLLLSCSDSVPLHEAERVGEARMTCRCCHPGCRREGGWGEGGGGGESWNCPMSNQPLCSMWLAASKHDVSRTATVDRHSTAPDRAGVAATHAAAHLCAPAVLSCARRRPPSAARGWVASCAAAGWSWTLLWCRCDLAPLGVVDTGGSEGQLLCAWC
jgi:hypothetical protein